MYIIIIGINMNNLLRKEHNVVENGLDNSERGMTLVEILAVVVLISIIMAVVAGGVFKKGDAAKASLNVTHMQSVKGYLETFKLQCGKYPSSLSALANDSGGSGCSGIYVPLADEKDLKDLFGTDLIYSSAHSGRGFKLTSYGADGVPGGSGADKDVTVEP